MTDHADPHPSGSLSDSDLRARLAALDPAAGRPVTALTDDLRERAMTSPSPARRTPLLVAAAAAAVLAAGGVAYAVAGSGPDERPSPTAKKTVLALQEPPPTTSASCIMLTADFLRTATHAFEGTVASVEGATVTLDVTHWYQGGDQDVVTVTAADPAFVEDGIRFEEGKTYLVASREDVVDGCSGTGEESPQLKSLFDEAFNGS